MSNLVTLIPGYGRFMKNSPRRTEPENSPKSVAKLEPEIEKIISKVIPSEDPLDRPEFDVTEFINRNFPDEHSLGDIEPFVLRLRNRVTALDEELSVAVQEQSRAGHQASIDIVEAKRSIENLFKKIKDIRRKAEQSEVMVQEICRDIKQLDYAKRHLQTTITALKRLHMLVTAVDQLEFMASKRLYREAANLLEAVKQLFTHFENYTNVGKIIELRTTVESIRAELSEQIFGDFKAVGELAELEKFEEDHTSMFKNLSAACSVIDALGAETRSKLIKAFCMDQLAPYVKMFGKGGPSSGLDCAEQRFPWFYRLLHVIDDKMDQVFPKHWRMPNRLCIEFCERTRAQLLIQLGQQTPEEIDVTLLLKALQKTIIFEKDMAQRFEGVDHVKARSESTEFNENGEMIEESSAEGIRRRLIRRKAEAEKRQIENEMKERGITITAEDTFPEILGIISSSFDPYMMSYVSFERKKLEEMITEVMSSERVDRDGPLPVFSSSVNMFVNIRNSVKRCTALTNGQTFFNLHNEFKACLRQYSTLLMAKLPKAVIMPNLGEAFRLADHQEEEICFVVNTAEYCADTLPSLEEAVRSKIDKAYRDAIDLSEEAGVFHDAAAASIKCLVSGLEVKLDGAMSTMLKLPWQTLESVGDQSDYVLSIGEVITAYVPTLRQMLSALYFNSFCDKFATSFLPRFLGNIFKCKRINEMGTQQLLLDAYGLKTIFLQLPTIGEKEASTIPPRYTKLVTKEISRTETVLKLVGTPNDMLVQSFKIMWPEGTSEDLQQVMSVKGLRKAEQQNLLEMLGLQKIPPKPMKMNDAIAGMEEKMSDMTGNIKKNMQNFAKGNVFSFTS